MQRRVLLQTEKIVGREGIDCKVTLFDWRDRGQFVTRQDCGKCQQTPLHSQASALCVYLGTISTPFRTKNFMQSDG